MRPVQVSRCVGSRLRVIPVVGSNLLNRLALNRQNGQRSDRYLVARDRMHGAVGQRSVRDERRVERNCLGSACVPDNFCRVSAGKRQRAPPCPVGAFAAGICRMS